MVNGNPQMWTPRFKSVDQRFIERVEAIWLKCLSILPEQPIEDVVTRNLVHLLNKDSVVRSFCQLHHPYAPFSKDPSGGVKGKGLIDFALIIDNDRAIYIAYECKNLNVTYNGSRQSLASKYVDEGMMRYVKKQYSEELPFACMLGYVIDGDIDFAKKQVWAVINTKKTKLGLLDGPQSTTKVATVERFWTEHQRSTVTSTIVVHHSFLPFATKP